MTVSQEVALQPSGLLVSALAHSAHAPFKCRQPPSIVWPHEVHTIRGSESIPRWQCEHTAWGCHVSRCPCASDVKVSQCVCLHAVAEPDAARHVAVL